MHLLPVIAIGTELQTQEFLEEKPRDPFRRNTDRLVSGEESWQGERLFACPVIYFFYYSFGLDKVLRFRRQRWLLQR